MGNDAKKNQKKADEAQRRQTTDLTSSMVNNQAFKPSPIDPIINDYYYQASSDSKNADAKAGADYSDIMDKYQSLYDNVPKATKFNWDKVNYTRPGEMDEAYGNLRSAGKGYQNFADTGGYSDQDVRELRARGMSPIRSAYDNTIRELDRANTLGGGAANYIAARSRAQRELPQQTADAMTTVNAGLADSIHAGKLQGLAGLSGVGSIMGGFASDEAGKRLSADVTNSQGNLNAAGMTEDSGQNFFKNKVGTVGAMNQLYGTTPGMASMFGARTLGGINAMQSNQASNRDFGMGLIDQNLKALNGEENANKTPWWHKALAVAGAAAPYVAMAASDKNIKHDISEPLDTKRIMKGIKKLNIHTWKYDGDNTTHMGPMAQDVKKHLGIGDGKTIHLADIMGVMLATAKSDSGART